MNLGATQLRPGNIIKHDGELFSIFTVTHRTPGNLRAFVQAKMRNLRTGALVEHRFRSEDRVEQAAVDEQEPQEIEKHRQQERDLLDAPARSRPVPQSMS